MIYSKHGQHLILHSTDYAIVDTLRKKGVDVHYAKP